ncbi:MAG: nitroreductase family protein [Desulfobacteraceae bacterium]|nr:nitroreductase family protein [Desulfobacteraceae bacterium]
MEILIDHDKCNCKQISLCSAICPYGFILSRNENNEMGLLKEYKHFCINCGQCASICPTSAINIVKNDEYPERYSKKTGISKSQAAQFLKTRRSVRAFKDKKIPRAEIEKILSITKWIPTASNKQKLKWLVIESSDKIHELARLTVEWINKNNISKEIVEQWEKGEDLILRKAPALIIVLGQKDNYWSGAEAGIALTYLELFAHANNLGTCWAGYFTRAVNHFAPLEDYLDLPEAYKICGSVMIGYPVYKLHSIPSRKKLSVIYK